MSQNNILNNYLFFIDLKNSYNYTLSVFRFQLLKIFSHVFLYLLSLIFVNHNIFDKKLSIITEQTFSLPQYREFNYKAILVNLLSND